MNTFTLKEMQKLWQVIARTDCTDNHEFDIEQYKKISDIFQVGEYYYYIFNLATAQIEYIQDNVNKVIGCPASDFTPEYLFEHMHPEDIPYFINCENTAKDFASTLSPEKLLKYKIRFDYRMKTTNGEYIRLLQQVLPIQISEEGGVLRVLGAHTDITHLKKEGKPVLSFIGLEDEPSYINVEIPMLFKATKEFLTRREKEILKHLAEGKKNQEIATTLSISKYTVDTHRKNILKKSGATKTLELIKKGVQDGWI